MLTDTWRKFFNGLTLRHCLSVLLITFFGSGTFIWSIPAINHGWMPNRSSKDLF